MLVQVERGRDEGRDGGKRGEGRREGRGGEERGEGRREGRMKRRGWERSQEAREGKCALDCILFLLSESESLAFQV